MWFWKRVEIYCGYSLEEFTALRNALASKNIKYDYKIIENNKKENKKTNPNMGNTLYYLYVHHKDYYQAMHLTSNRSR